MFQTSYVVIEGMITKLGLDITPCCMIHDHMTGSNKLFLYTDYKYNQTSLYFQYIFFWWELLSYERGKHYYTVISSLGYCLYSMCTSNTIGRATAQLA